MKKFQIAFVGINSLYGSTSALLLKQSPFIKCLKLFDTRDVESGLDVATINTQCKVKTFQGHDQLENAFREADIIVISDESSEMADNEAHLMNLSANLNKYAKAISRASPDAIIVVASPPVNCLLPIMSHLLAKAGCYNHNKVVGSTSVDTMRASALLARNLNMDPKEVVLPVIGGGSEYTRVPVFSQSRPHFSLKKDVKNNLIMDIRRGDSLVLANKGSPETMNRAYSTVRFLNSIMAGLRGEPNVTDITMSRTDLIPGVEYFSLPVMFGREGIIKRFGVPNTTASEDEMVEEAVKHVKIDADKAEYIVKGTVELPEQKYLSANERASSQKDMFDLFVKCLPKPQDLQETGTENLSKKAADYSFKNLIKEDPTRDPFEGFDKKSHHRTLATKLKNVTSADSFLKSAGCYTSPLQKPILILEPLGCPSRPIETDEDRELEGFLENEDILHENNLARFREKETYGERQNQKFGPSPTKNQPFSSTNTVHKKTIDPIANFKAQAAKFHEYRQHENKSKVEENQLEEISLTCEATVASEEQNAHNDYKAKSAMTAADTASSKKKVKPIKENHRCTSTQTPNKKDEQREELFPIPQKKEVHFSSPSGRCMKKKYGTTNRNDSYIFDIKTNRIIPSYNLYKKGKCGKADYVPEEENGKSYLPSGEIEESLYNRGRLEGAENDEKYNKLVSRLFKKLNGLNDASYFPLKTTSEERAIGLKCKKSFTESAVRCRSPNSASLKIQKKYKKSISELESGNKEDFPQELTIPKKKNQQNDEQLIQETRSHSNRSQRENVQFKDIEDETSHSHDHLKEKLCENKEVQFVCPKCQIKITCQPEKDMQDAKSRTPERVASDIPEQGVRKTRQVNVKSYKVRDCQTSSKNEVFTAKTPYEDERLKKLKEKINRKLAPMMRQSTHESSNSRHDPSSPTTVIHAAPKPANDFETEDSKSRANELGTPLVVTRNYSEPQSKPADAHKVKSNLSEKWQGVPFIVKRSEKKSENIDGKNRAVFMKIVVPPAYKESPRVEDKTMKSQLQKMSGECENKVHGNIKNAESKNTDEMLKSAESIVKTGRRAAKILNKLQLLELEGRRKPDMDETNNETKEKSESNKFHKEQIKKEICAELKADEVRNYMMTRQRGSRNVLVRESSNKCKQNSSAEEKPSAVFEKIDFDHLKSETIKDLSPDLQSKPANEPNKNKLASEVSKLEEPVLNKGMQNKDALIESKSSTTESKTTVSAESQATKDDKALKNIQSETIEVKQTTTEQNWAMTSPSKNFENIEEPTVSASKEATMTLSQVPNTNLQSSLKTESAADKKTTQKFMNSMKPPLEPTVVAFHKTPNKLQLLAKVRNSKQRDNDAFKIKLQRKLKNVWERVLSDKPVQTKFEPAGLPVSLKHVGAAFDKLDKKSAAVRIAKKSKYAAPKKVNLYNTKGVPNNIAILDGLTFPARRKRKPTNNLLKELASFSKRREVAKPVKLKQKGVVKRVPVKPTRVRLSKSERYEGIKPGTSLEPESSEYAQDEMQMSKLASELLKKKTLRSAFDVRNRDWGHPKEVSKAEKAISNVQIQQMPKNFVSIERPRTSVWELGPTKDRKGTKSAPKAEDVLNKLMSMPHVRHQVENFELPLGPLEVRPGLAQFNYSKVGIFSPIRSEGSWEPSIVNEYSRSNVLPSLRDTRETFHLEERPS